VPDGDFGMGGDHLFDCRDSQMVLVSQEMTIIITSLLLKQNQQTIDGRKLKMYRSE
jgi:hypothetical protein